MWCPERKYIKKTNRRGHLKSSDVSPPPEQMPLVRPRLQLERAYRVRRLVDEKGGYSAVPTLCRTKQIDGSRNLLGGHDIRIAASGELCQPKNHEADFMMVSAISSFLDQYCR